MVGSKGSGNTGSVEWMDQQLYCDGDGRLYVYNRYSARRTYLTQEQITKRLRWDNAYGSKARIRVQARRAA